MTRGKHHSSIVEHYNGRNNYRREGLKHRIKKWIYDELNNMLRWEYGSNYGFRKQPRRNRINRITKQYENNCGKKQKTIIFAKDSIKSKLIAEEK